MESCRRESSVTRGERLGRSEQTRRRRPTTERYLRLQGESFAILRLEPPPLCLCSPNPFQIHGQRGPTLLISREQRARSDRDSNAVALSRDTHEDKSDGALTAASRRAQRLPDLVSCPWPTDRQLTFASSPCSPATSHTTLSPSGRSDISQRNGGRKDSVGSRSTKSSP